MVSISAEAQQYLHDLLDKQQDDAVIGIRIFVNDPGTPQAETCIAYCRTEDKSEDDEQQEYADFIVWFDRRSMPFLAEASVDFLSDRMGGQLTIRAPNSKLPRIDDDSPLPDRINYLLQTEINPNLAQHGGMVSLVELTDDQIAVLRFGGGCQGCGMVDVTLKDGVEKMMMEKLPELGGVRDVTDHSDRSQAYYS